MAMKRAFQSVILASLLICASMASAQYEAEPFVEGFVGPNFTLPMGYVKNDLTPDSLKATSGIGLDIGAGYYFKPTLVGGLYFNVRNMGTEELELKHRVFEFGAYGKYLFNDLMEASWSPYLRLTAGLNFSKMVTKVEGEIGPIFRELSHKPTLGTGISAGLQKKTNELGAVYFEATFNFDMMDGVAGQYKGVDYKWGGNNQYLVFKAGVVINIGSGK